MSGPGNLVPQIANRRARLAAYTDAPKVLDHCVMSDYPPGLIDWRPSVPGAWTIREHLVHCADADINSFIRFSKAIAESGSTIPDWDQEGWCKALGYAQQSATVSLQLIRLLRSIVATRLGAISPASWDAASCVHPTRGILTLDGLLEIYTAHIGMHVQFIERNETLWAGETPENRARAAPCR